MSNNRKPATPLPWQHGTVKDRTFCIMDAKGDYVSHLLRAGEELNISYITHACNAYPKLVSMLRATLEMYATQPTQAVAAKALLRQLGEAE